MSKRPSPTSGEPRVALVTGAARGIGQAIAERLALDGLRVVGLDVQPIASASLDRAITADLADPAQCDEALREAGRIDVLVNNAAILLYRATADLTVEEFDRMVAVNLRAVFLLSRGAAVGMVERRWGRIINISSVGARTGGRFDTLAYAATKSAVLALTKGMAWEYGRFGVTVNAVAPGGVRGTAMSPRIAPERVAGYEAAIPSARVGAPADVAGVVAFLASDEAAYVNGTTLDVNGGQVMV